MKTLRSIGMLLTLLAVMVLASCAKEDRVAPHDCQDGEDVQTKELLDQDGGGRPGMPSDIQTSKGDPANTLRDGGGEEGGEGSGGISDDGDDEADGERNKKDQH